MSLKRKKQLRFAFSGSVVSAGSELDARANTPQNLKGRRVLNSRVPGRPPHVPCHKDLDHFKACTQLPLRLWLLLLQHTIRTLWLNTPTQAPTATAKTKSPPLIPLTQKTTHTHTQARQKVLLVRITPIANNPPPSGHRGRVSITSLAAPTRTIIKQAWSLPRRIGQHVAPGSRDLNSKPQRQPLAARSVALESEI